MGVLEGKTKDYTRGTPLPGAWSRLDTTSKGIQVPQQRRESSSGPRVGYRGHIIIISTHPWGLVRLSNSYIYILSRKGKKRKLRSHQLLFMSEFFGDEDCDTY
jgi:hypothetical protein